jgi:hypothetical protein
MSTRMNRRSLRTCLLPLAAMALFTAGTSLTQAESAAAAQTKGETFVIGTDAPLASVASFTVQIQSIDAIDSTTGASQPLLSSPASVDFARFNGLQTLLDINQVPVGTYNKVVVTLGTAQIGYLSVVSGMPPAILTMNALLSTNTITKTLTDPLVVTAAEPVGIRMDFDLHKSIQVIDGGITGSVDPVFDIGVVRPTAPGAFIDEFDTAVLNTDQGAQKFMVQGPHGRQWTIDVTGNTEWDNGATFSDLNTNTIVQISGTLERATSTITADEITILSQNGFWAGGLATYVNPSSGVASSFDLYVRGLLPASGTGTTGVKLGQIATVDVTSTDKFYVRWDRNPLTQFVFNSSALLPGQSISVGGPLSGAVNASAVTVKRINLRDWGYIGKVVPGSVKTGKDTFQMQVDGFAGQLIPQTITVYVTDRCQFRYGYTGLHELEGGDTVRVVGLLLKNPVSGETTLVGHYVDYLN